MNTKEQRKLYRRSKRGLIAYIYGHQRYHSKARKHLPPDYTGAELREWLYSQQAFHELYNKWKAGGYQTIDIPSCDRIDNTVGYKLSNLRVTTWAENRADGCLDKRKGLLGTSKQIVPVISTDSLGGELHHISIHEAARYSGADPANICFVCQGKRNTAGGYKWRYKTTQDLQI